MKLKFNSRSRLKRLLLAGLLATILLLISLTGLYLVRLGALRSRVLNDFEALANNAYFHIVCDPLRVRVGSDARALGVSERLARAGYQHVDTRPVAGEYRTQRGSIQFRRLPGKATHDDRLVNLKLEGPVVSRIEVGGERFEWVELPPEPLGSFRQSVHERRLPLRYQDIPPNLITAVLAAEDRRFFHHRGLDGRGIGRAFLRNLKQRRVVEGGSTITQQVVKQLLNRRGRSLHAKIDEALLALSLDHRFNKRQILQVYLNEVYLGQEGPFRIHGVAEGARFYFGKPLETLLNKELLELAASIRAPNAASPRHNPERLRPYTKAIAEALALVRAPATVPDSALAVLDQPSAGILAAAGASNRLDFETAQLGYYFDQLQREWTSVEKKYRIQSPATLVIGVDPVLQLRAAESLQRGLRDARQRSPRSDETPLQGAVVVIDPEDGALRAILGGNDYALAPFNRAIDARRPVGSTFKPLVYLAALGARGDDPIISQSTWLPDEQREYRVGRQAWRPANFDGTYRGWVTARQALAQSINAATVALGMTVGVKEIAHLAEEMGVEDHVPNNPSILLGAVETSPLRLAAAYAALANGGRSVQPHALVAVQAGDRIIDDPFQPPRHILDARACYIVTDMLVGAIRSGTGASAVRHGFEHLSTGKTGTTDGMRDAWFVGYTPEIVASVWVGFDNNSPVGLTGARAALPIWARLMRSWLGEGWDQDFEPPPGIVFRRIDPESGELANRSCSHIESAAYLEEHAPERGCTLHGATVTDRYRQFSGRLDEEARRERWLGMRKKRGFWARLKDALGV